MTQTMTDTTGADVVPRSNAEKFTDAIAPYAQDVSVRTGSAGVARDTGWTYVTGRSRRGGPAVGNIEFLAAHYGGGFESIISSGAFLDWDVMFYHTDDPTVTAEDFEDSEGVA